MLHLNTTNSKHLSSCRHGRMVTFKVLWWWNKSLITCRLSHFF